MKIFTVLTLLFMHQIYAQTGLGNSAWETGVDFFGNPASQFEQQGSLSSFELSRPWLGNQYYSAVSTWDNFGIGFQYFTYGASSLKSYKTSLQYSERIFENFTLGFRSNLHKGSFYSEGDNVSLDWGFKWSPWGLISIGLDHRGFQQWQGEVSRQTNYGIWTQLFDGVLQGGLSWQQDGIELPFTDGKSKRRFDLDSATIHTQLNLGAIELGLQLPQYARDHYQAWRYSLQVKNDFSSLGLYDRPENNSKTFSYTTYELKTRKRKFNFGQKVLTLGGDIRDGKNSFSLLGSSNHTSLLGIIQTIHSISSNPVNQELILNLEPLSVNWANAREIRQALIEIQSKGTKVTAFLENPDNKSYYIASMANKIVVHPAAYVKLLGFSAEVNFYKGLFDTLGVQAQFIRHGKFKSAVEPYTLDSISPEAKKDIEDLQGSLWKTISMDIQKARKISLEDFNNYVDSAFMSNSAALEAKLIDEVAYFDEIVHPVNSHYLNIQQFNYQQNTLAHIKKIAVIQTEGSIIYGESGSNSFSNAKYIGHKTLERQLWNAAHNDEISAVILRVNSPGGSAWASDAIHRAVSNFKESGKPIIASVGGVAASGGYYYIAGVDRIFAEPTSILGSIGIFGGKFVIKGLYNKLGINTSVIKTHESADAESMQRPWSEKEVTRIQDHMDDFYNGFVQKVAQGRGIDSTVVDTLGQGRVYTGADALHHQLVDQEGGLMDAIRYTVSRLNSPFISERFHIVNVSHDDDSWMDVPSPLMHWSTEIQDVKKPLLDYISTLENQTLWAYNPYLESTY